MNLDVQTSDRCIFKNHHYNVITSHSAGYSLCLPLTGIPHWALCTRRLTLEPSGFQPGFPVQGNSRRLAAGGGRGGWQEEREVGVFVPLGPSSHPVLTTAPSSWTAASASSLLL